MDDLEQAIARAQEAVAAMPLGHQDRALYMDDLGSNLGIRYIRIGDINDLEMAIAYAQEAVAVAPLTHPDRAMYLSNLGNSFRVRYSRTGSSDDLEQAFMYAQEAVAVAPVGHPRRALCLSNLGNSFRVRHSRTGSSDDIEQAIVYAKEAVAATALGHPERPLYLSNLGSSLGTRYIQTGSSDDIDQAIVYAQEAVVVAPLSHPERPLYLSNLGISFRARHSLSDNIDDLDQAIANTEQAVAATPLDHPDRSSHLNSLGICFRKRFYSIGSKQDEERSLRLFQAGVSCPTSGLLPRLHNGRNALQILSRHNNWNAASVIVATLFGLLPNLCNRYLSRDDQQHVLMQVSGLAADACSLSLKLSDPHQALQRVEFGRALMLGYLVDGRSDISELALAHPDLASEYDGLRSRAFSTQVILEDEVIRENRLGEQQKVSELLEDCENRIRGRPGFEHFLRPAAVDELMQSAEEGPVVIVNCTDISSDAIIVLTSSIVVVPLRSMSPEPPKSFQKALKRHRTVEKRGYQRDVESNVPHQHDTHLLSWLWSTCVSPILQKVAEQSIGRVAQGIPRIWWIGTGAASSLPFHAAGNYGKCTKDGFDNCLSQCISSYTPSIKGLQHARTIALKASEMSAERPSLLVVTMPTTPGERELTGASLEEKVIQGVAGDRWAIRSLACPAASQVLKEIHDTNIVHFACHGSSDALDPMASHLLLQKEDGGKRSVDKLTVAALLDATTQPQAWIAYLSACSTAEIKMQKLADETLHLTSAFQMAGFAHVIGSLRPADDHICVQVAKLFYSFLVESGRSRDLNRAVPEALNYAVRKIADEYPQSPDLWAPFIHLGA